MLLLNELRLVYLEWFYVQQVSGVNMKPYEYTNLPLRTLLLNKLRSRCAYEA
jgi:hypothetical protein